MDKIEKHIVKGKRTSIQEAKCLICGTILRVPAPYDAARRLRQRNCPIRKQK